MMKNKPSYRELERQNERMRDFNKKELSAFRDSAEEVIGELVVLLSEAQVLQAVMESLVKDIAFKRRTAGDAKIFIETRLEKLAEFEGTLEDKLEWLGVDNFEAAYREAKEHNDKLIGDYAIKLYQRSLMNK